MVSKARVLLKVDSCDYLKFSENNDLNDINASIKDTVLVEYICHITDREGDEDKKKSRQVVQTIHCLILKKFGELGYWYVNSTRTECYYN